MLQRGKPGRPPKKLSLKDETELNISDIQQSMDRLQSTLTKMMVLEEERNQYKRAYIYLMSLLGKYLSEHEMYYIQAITEPQPDFIIKQQLEQNEHLNAKIRRKK